MKKSTPRHHAERLQWLRDNPKQWAGLPSLREDVSDRGRTGLLRLVALMTECGLFSRNTPMTTRVLGVRGLIGEAKGQTPYMSIG